MTGKGLVRLSVSLKRVFVEQFTPEALRHIASLMESESPRTVASRSLSDASLNKFAEMPTAGRTPTIAFWRKHLPVTDYATVNARNLAEFVDTQALVSEAASYLSTAASVCV